MSLDKKAKNFLLSSNDDFNFSEDTTPIDYLYHSKTSELIKEALNEVIFFQPADPIQFLVDYFTPVNKNVVDEAYQLLQRCRYTDSIYQRNVLEVYNMLQMTKNKDTNLRGLLGETFNHLLDMIHKNSLHDYKIIWLSKLKVHKTCVVTFNHFYNSILWCFVMEDFLLICSSIFEDLDLENCGKVNQELCSLFMDSIKCDADIVSPFDHFMDNINGNMETFQFTSGKYTEKYNFIKQAIELIVTSTLSSSTK